MAKFDNRNWLVPIVIISLAVLFYFLYFNESLQYSPYQDLSEISTSGCVDIYGSPIGTSVASPMYGSTGDIITGGNLTVSDCMHIVDQCILLCAPLNQRNVGTGAPSQISSTTLTYLNGQVTRMRYDFICECYNR